MGYGSKIRLGDSFDGDSSLSTSFVYSDIINPDGKKVEITVTLVGSSGDTDTVEVYQFIEEDTEGYLLGKITLNGATAVISNFFVKKVRVFKVGLKMESGSSETPNYKGEYSIVGD